MDDNLLEVYKNTIGDVVYEDIALAPLCDLFKISLRHHRETIKNHKGLSQLTLEVADPSRYGNNRQYFSLTKKGFVWWVLQLSYKIVVTELQALFVQYQLNLLDYLYDAAYEREQLLKKKAKLESECNKLEKSLQDDNEDYNLLMAKKAEIMRLGKESKVIDSKIVTRQMELNFQ